MTAIETELEFKLNRRKGRLASGLLDFNGMDDCKLLSEPSSPPLHSTALKSPADPNLNNSKSASSQSAGRRSLFAHSNMSELRKHGLSHAHVDEVPSHHAAFRRGSHAVAQEIQSHMIMDPKSKGGIVQMAQRATRLRVYIGTLLGYGLELVHHDYTLESVEKMLNKDLKTAARCGVDDPSVSEVSAAFSRVNLLLDTAEMRIRDSILCGWSRRGPELNSCLELMINGYYIEIISMLSKFFDSKGLEAVKGVDSKLQLISFFFENNVLNQHELSTNSVLAQY